MSWAKINLFVFYEILDVFFTLKGDIIAEGLTTAS